MESTDTLRRNRKQTYRSHNSAGRGRDASAESGKGIQRLAGAWPIPRNSTDKPIRRRLELPLLILLLFSSPSFSVSFFSTNPSSPSFPLIFSSPPILSLTPLLLLLLLLLLVFLLHVLFFFLLSLFFFPLLFQEILHFDVRRERVNSSGSSSIPIAS